MFVLDLTVSQAGLLFEVTELQLEWFKRKYSKSPLFEVLLELNHNKLKYAMKLVEIDKKEKHTETDITNELIRMKNSYLMLIKYF